MNNKINVIDLFAGCGGLTEGFEMHGAYSFIAAVEWERRFCDTLSHRLKTHWRINDSEERVIHFDIQRLDELFNGWQGDAKFGDHKGLDKIVNNRSVDLVIGGPPCQAYSLAGRIRDAQGMHNDYRNFLFESYVKIVAHYRPDAFVFENVLGMLSAKPGGISIVDRIYDQFEEIGYQISSDLRKQAVFNVADFGIPQNRRRVIIYGVNKQKTQHPQKVVDNFYDKLNTYKTSKVSTVKDAISDLEPLYPLKNGPQALGKKKYSHHPFRSDVNWHVPRFHSSRDIQLFKMLADDIKSGGNLYTSSDEIKALYTKLTGKNSNVHKYYVLREDKPSNTIPAHLHKDGLRHIHPDPKQARTITVREAARLQTFPDDFEFIGSQSDAYKMIGNAVPPLFAKYIAFAAENNFG